MSELRSDVLSTDSLVLPITPYEVFGYFFGQRVRSRKILWARHLGDDIVVAAGTAVVCIGNGTVVWSQMRNGSPEKRNWGGVVIVEHVHPHTGLFFYSVYGHLTDLAVSVGARISKGDTVGSVAAGNTPENGYWKLAHLHFGIYTGPWNHAVLPGYARPFEGRTRFRWWQNPKPFIDSYTA
jgi:murein DD-endopeptidase MepM/ murein hydrolase activator NlpD